jgi:hypothetical protein
MELVTASHNSGALRDERRRISCLLADSSVHARERTHPTSAVTRRQKPKILQTAHHNTIVSLQKPIDYAQDSYRENWIMGKESLMI